MGLGKIRVMTELSETEDQPLSSSLPDEGYALKKPPKKTIRTGARGRETEPWRGQIQGYGYITACPEA